ncbi:hypothetical protein FBY10_11520 [Pseudomonas sp. SJZ103]|nr:hypothetical protein FBY10_11520 [Pseudomonas sp. SJZ103]TWC80310.1 hypothetical protein FBY08_116158 [Pseudomonas sp. SJZ094]
MKMTFAARLHNLSSPNAVDRLPVPTPGDNEERLRGAFINIVVKP